MEIKALDEIYAEMRVKKVFTCKFAHNGINVGDFCCLKTHTVRGPQPPVFLLWKSSAEKFGNLCF